MSTTEPSPPTPPLPPASSTSEPVLIAHSVTVILGALCGLGWFTVPNTTIDLVGTGVFVVVSTIGAVIARGKVTSATGGAPSAADWQAYVTGIVRQEVAAYQQWTATQTPPVSALQPSGAEWRGPR